MITATERTHPTWCTQNHPALEQGTHQGVPWEAYGLAAQLVDHHEDGLLVSIEKGAQNLDLTPEQAHELGLQLVRMADTLRRESQR